MELNELELAVTLQKKAYGLLLWLKQAARSRPRLLSMDETDLFVSGEKCVIWVKRHLNEFPRELRPSPDEFRDIGYLLSSFFRTSFRVAETRFWDDDARKTLVVGAKEFKGRRHKRHSEQREREAADELKRLALVALAEECGLKVPPDMQDHALAAADLAHDLALWTYGCELVRRTHFTSQGGAVHRLWLELNEKTRKNLSAESIWKARARLAQWLTNNQVRGET